MRLTKSILLCTVLCLSAITLHAQSISDIDFKNIRVDELSDQQIQRIYKGAQSRNLSIDQAVNMAVSRGLPSSQAYKLKRRLRLVQSGSLTGPGNESQIPGNLRHGAQYQGPQPDSTTMDSRYMIADSCTHL